MNNTPSAAAQIIISIIPIVGIVMGCMVIFFYLLWNHKQKVLLIQKDVYHKQPFDFDFFSLFSGIVLFSVGFSLTVFFLLKDGLGYGVLSGLIPLMLGLGFITFFIIRVKFFKNK